MWNFFKSKLKKASPEQGRRVFVGLSGGVDSAVSAALLKQQGYDVTGVFIKVWQPFDEAQGKPLSSCNWKEERRDAMRVALALGIPFLFFDFEKEYKKGVADYMIEEYRVGRTPNPDVLCNKEVKFGAFWKKAKSLGADYIATGHYAQVKNVTRKSTEVFSAENHPDSRAAALRDPFSKQYSSLVEGKDKDKDQSYFLWTLTPHDLEHVLFPVGGMKKSEVRKLAEKFNLPVAEKKDSQGVCFIGEISLEEFLSHFIPSKPGKVINTSGEVIGKHNGALHYTIGERHGFEIEKKQSDSGKFYVVAKDMKKNTITVSNIEKEIIEMSPRRVVVKNANWIKEPEGPSFSARIRYRGEKLPVALSLEKKDLVITFSNPVRGLSLGQSIVFYDNDVVLGGAVMERVVS
jgi:tRNA-uridine 2-sulfurtransferase